MVHPGHAAARCRFPRDDSPPSLVRSSCMLAASHSRPLTHRVIVPTAKVVRESAHPSVRSTTITQIHSCAVPLHGGPGGNGRFAAPCIGAAASAIHPDSRSKFLGGLSFSQKVNMIRPFEHPSRGTWSCFGRRGTERPKHSRHDACCWTRQARD